MNEESRMLITVAEAAVRLGVGRSYLYSKVMAGDIASVKLGRSRRIPVAALERFVEESAAAEGMGVGESPT